MSLMKKIMNLLVKILKLEYLINVSVLMRRRSSPTVIWTVIIRKIITQEQI